MGADDREKDFAIKKIITEFNITHKYDNRIILAQKCLQQKLETHRGQSSDLHHKLAG